MPNPLTASLKDALKRARPATPAFAAMKGVEVDVPGVGTFYLEEIVKAEFDARVKRRARKARVAHFLGGYRPSRRSGVEKRAGEAAMAVARGKPVATLKGVARSAAKPVVRGAVTTLD